LLDAAHKLAQSDVNKAIAAKEEEFNRMLADISGKIDQSKDRLNILENPPPEEEEKKSP
jgi:F0F1-type ATP synthase membrane subunit b/b'